LIEFLRLFKSWIPLIWVSLLFLGSQAKAQKSARDTVVNIEQDTIPKRLLTINRVIIIGNKVTKEQIISRELSLKPGDTISTKRIEGVLLLDQRKIYNLRLFNTVTIQSLELSTSQVDLLVEVNERWYTFPVPIFELSDRNFNEWWQNYNHDLKRVNYGLRLYQYNFRGRNETLRFTAQFGFTRKFELSYRIPYIDHKQRHGLIFDFNYDEPKNLAYLTEDHKLNFLEEKKTIKVSRGFGVSYTFRKSFYETHSLSFAYKNNHVLDTIAYLNPNYYKDAGVRQQFSSITYTFNSEHRDVIAYPLKGYQLTAFAQRTGLLIDSDVQQWELNLTYAKFIDLGDNYYFSNFSSAYVSTPSDQPYSFFSALGYRRQLVKGYEVYVIEGPSFFLNKTTLRKRILSRTWQLEGMPIEQFRYFPLAIYLKGYFDLGYVDNYPYYENLQLNNRLSNRMLVGTGAGIDIVTAYDAVIRLEYTFTREKTHGFFFHMKKEF
jgi:outer membrane protein assembly factor BamA